MATLEVNGKTVDAMPGDNLIQAARRAGVEIPFYCWHPDLTVVASCRMCLVEVGQRQDDGTVNFDQRLQPACQLPAKPGIIVRTDSEIVRKTQAMTLEQLLLNHPLDCSICDQAGECYLQDYSHKFGNEKSRLQEPKIQRKDKYHIGQQIALFTDRCVMCTRCVRFTREVSGGAELQIIQRGSTEEIDVFPGHGCNDKLAGNVVDLCPVGALCSKDFLYSKRVWWLKSQNSVCPGCSTGCSISIDQNEQQIYRLRPRENPLAQGHFMCDDGRFGFKYIHDERRLTQPLLRGIASEIIPRDVVCSRADDLSFDDKWPHTMDTLRRLLRERIGKTPERSIALFSPFMTVEEAFLLATFLRKISPRSNLAMGPIPVVGENDYYPKFPNGSSAPADKARFTIRSEKCPNRAGVAWVIDHFQRPGLGLDEVIVRAKRNEWDTAIMTGGYPETWVTADFNSAFQSVTLLVVQDIFPSLLSERAQIVIPGGSFAERNGSFVNHSGLVQAIRPAIRSPGQARPDGRIFWELAEREGLFDPVSVRREMAATIKAFARFANETLEPNGISLTDSVRLSETKAAVANGSSGSTGAGS